MDGPSTPADLCSRTPQGMQIKIYVIMSDIEVLRLINTKCVHLNLFDIGYPRRPIIKPNVQIERYMFVSNYNDPESPT